MFKMKGSAKLLLPLIITSILSAGIIYASVLQWQGPVQGTFQVLSNGYELTFYSDAEGTTPTSLTFPDMHTSATISEISTETTTYLYTVDPYPIVLLTLTDIEAPPEFDVNAYYYAGGSYNVWNLGSPVQINAPLDIKITIVANTFVEETSGTITLHFDVYDF